MVRCADNHVSVFPQGRQRGYGEPHSSKADTASNNVLRLSSKPSPGLSGQSGHLAWLELTTCSSNALTTGRSTSHEWKYSPDFAIPLTTCDSRWCQPPSERGACNLSSAARTSNTSSGTGSPAWCLKAAKSRCQHQ